MVLIAFQEGHHLDAVLHRETQTLDIEGRDLVHIRRIQHGMGDLRGLIGMRRRIGVACVFGQDVDTTSVGIDEGEAEPATGRVASRRLGDLRRRRIAHLPMQSADRVAIVGQQVELQNLWLGMRRQREDMVVRPGAAQVNRIRSLGHGRQAPDAGIEGLAGCQVGNAERDAADRGDFAGTHRIISLEAIEVQRRRA